MEGASHVIQATKIAPFRIAQSGGETSNWQGAREVSQISQDISKELGRLKGELGDALFLVGLAAITVLIAAQLFKFPLRVAFQMLTTWRWLTRKRDQVHKFDDSLKTPPVWIGTLTDVQSFHPGDSLLLGWKQSFSILVNLLPFLPKELYVKKVQNAAQRVLERPSDNPRMFAHIAADAAVDDTVIVYCVDSIVRVHPEFLSQIAEFDQQGNSEAQEKEESGKASISPKPEPGFAAAIAAAQDNVATAVERGLDDLQIRIVFWWPIWMRTAAVVLGIAVVLYFGWNIVPGHRWWLVLIGIAAGYLAALAYDVLSFIAALKPSRQ